MSMARQKTDGTRNSTRSPRKRGPVKRVPEPVISFSELDGIRYLHFGSPWVQGAMDIERPDELVLSYIQDMMAWLLFADPPVHITQIGLGGGSFARWIDACLPDCRQTAVEINPNVIAVARGLFELPFEGETFEIVEADGAQYVKTLRGGTDIILTDGFDGEQIIDDLVSPGFFADCRQALSDKGIFMTNWWSGDKRYPRFVADLKEAFDGKVLEVPAESHGNIAVMAFRQAPAELNLDSLKKRAEQLARQYPLDFPALFSALKSANPHNGKHLHF